MSQTQGRSRSINILFAAAGAALLLAVLSMMQFGGPRLADKVGQIVLPAFEADVTRANRIKVTLANEAYEMSRDGEGWVMIERGGYPVRVDMLANLSEALAAMTYQREMTRDPAKFDQLGLGDPREDGAGALLNVYDANETPLVDLIVGFKNGASYVRIPGDDQAWSVTTTAVPPLQRAARWLDLDVLEVDVSQIARTEVLPFNGVAFAMAAVADQPGRFALEPPHDTARLKTSYAANPAAIVLASMLPTDAIPRDQLEANPVGAHRTYLYSGLMIEAELHRGEAGRFWVTFSEGLEAESPELQAQLEQIEDRVAGWAFQISRSDFAIFTTKLSDITAPTPAPAN